MFQRIDDAAQTQQLFNAVNNIDYFNFKYELKYAHIHVRGRDQSVGTMAFTLEDKENISVGQHSFRACELDSNSDWLEDSANEYRKLLTEFTAPMDAIAFDGIDLVDIETLKAYIAPKLIPKFSGSNLDVVRSDFGEVLSYMLLEDHYSTKIVSKPVRERELTNITARGIDVVGIENGEKLRLIIGETKVSEDPSTPPAVVDENDDCLRIQLSSHIAKKDRTIDKLLHIARKSSSVDLRDELIAAVLYWQNERWDRLELICCGLLIRPCQCYKKTDFGKMLIDQKEFGQANIRFIILIIPNLVKDTIKKWHGLVCQGAS